MSREQRLEAALRELVDAVWVTPADNVRWEAVRTQVDAALGDQEAPTERAGQNIDVTVAPTHWEAPTEPNGWGDCEACGLAWPCPSAPQGEPEPYCAEYPIGGNDHWPEEDNR